MPRPPRRSRLTERLSSAESRRLALLAQRLAGPRPRPTRAGILDTVRDLGYLQLDPTNVVARNPQLVLWSRLGTHDPALVERLLFRERALLERITLIVPTADLPIHAESMRRWRREDVLTAGAPRHSRAGRRTYPHMRRAKAWVDANAALRRYVLRRLRAEGPLPLSAFEDRAIVSWTSSGWTNERNVSRMLELLLRQGRVVVAGRPRGHRMWAIADAWVPVPSPLSPRRLAIEATARAMLSLGVATLSQLRRHYAFARYVSTEALAALERDGSVTQVEIEGAASRDRWYADAEALRQLGRPEGLERTTTLLSPFDNLIIDRERTERLFGMRYRMEIYVPKHLRVRGFWAMPILHGDRLVGTLDPRFERERGELVVNGLRWDAPPRLRPSRKELRAAVSELAAFVRAARVVWG